jgi:hypothetical protein
LTLGNACTTNGECCSSNCASNRTCQAASFCAQPGDACAASTECCTGTCTTAPGMSLGTCAAVAPSGPANCGLADGQLCGGAGTSGASTVYDGGLPACGGACCSRACAPWGPTGVLVCQPASGCHVVGDLCGSDGDCCGSAGLPGGSGTPVTCVITPPEKVGVCRNPMGCKPDGDVCKLAATSCNSSCDCCSGNCENKDTCHQDNVGVPRCSPATCVSAGNACASSADCCGVVPCVPNPVSGATPPFVCLGAQCVGACGACTTTADCCPGSSCQVPVGSTHGSCGPCGAGGASGSPAGGTGGSGASNGSSGASGSGSLGGASGATSSSGSVSATSGASGPSAGASGGAPACSQYGQLCTTSADCCSGLPCSGGRCGVVIIVH